MKRFLILAIMFAGTPRAARDVIGSDAFTHRLVNFHHVYSEFFREYFGCPKTALTVEECDPKLGTVDYAAYLKMNQLAAKVFPR